LSEITGKQSEPQNGPTFSLEMVRQFFASLKLAILLILVLVGLTLIGVFVIQVPAEYSADPQNYIWWLENIAQTETGAWYPLLKFLGFFNLFHSIWFILTGLLLAVNIIVCSLNRLNQVKSRLFFKPAVHDRAFFTASSGISTISNISSSDELVSFLKKRRYQVIVAGREGETHVSAVKNRFSTLGTYLIHFSIILFILGFVVGHYWGFQNSSFVVAENQNMAVGYNTGLTLKLVDFQYEAYPDGSPKTYRSQIVLMQDQQSVKTGTIEVNHPLKYKGVRFYQSFYGPAENLQITQNKRVIFSGMVALDSTMNNHPYLRPAGVLQLSEQGYNIYLVAAATNISDPALKSTQLGIEVYRVNSREVVAARVLDLNIPLTAGDLEITYTGSGLFSGFLVNSDPGVAFIWTGSAFLLIGLVAVFYFPSRRLQAALIPNLDNSLDLYLRWDNSSVNSGDAWQLSDYLTNKLVNKSSGYTQKEN
jgi:cytochrome c biogenesis protein